ncbi:MAG: class I SAM-dependent methyltransferase [Ignavibacteria bacterium]|jgi:O-methyltransferase involved in polyketide biosynthesis
MSTKLLNPKLSNIPETMLIPLRARYLETKTENGIINDPKSVEILDGIDYDFSGKKGVSKGTQIGTAIRTEILDEQTNKFLAHNPNSVVVNLGCGLDTRHHRLDNGIVTWFDLDLPGSIEFRKNFFNETYRFKFISKSFLDFSWVDQIPKSKPTLFIVEGLLMYFTEEEVKSLFKVISENFPDAEMLLEAMSPIMVKDSNQHPDLKTYNASFKWGIKTGKEIENWNIGANFVNEWYYFDRHRERAPFIYKIFILIPVFRKMMKIVHLKF